MSQVKPHKETVKLSESIREWSLLCTGNKQSVRDAIVKKRVLHLTTECSLFFRRPGMNHATSGDQRGPRLRVQGVSSVERTSSRA